MKRCWGRIIKSNQYQGNEMGLNTEWKELMLIDAMEVDEEGGGGYY